LVKKRVRKQSKASWRHILIMAIMFSALC
jgi:hypothetical protein